ncbi:ABC transporter permease [Pedobacter gandavensis]|uniref:FtsX-like permease family protein n=1 Tax=Pedobacter gandavensis TaxID=2679963 RepID=A0ABR6EQP2_9SPHI|nr:ABC transporter permease [Pedobacter gandavensis]MBB2147565.1 FtsX-like permease family protein [Pedobacter gandavensis]
MMYQLTLKIALRNLWKNKSFSLLNIGGLAIGLCCCMLLLLYVNYEWSYDRQFKNIDRIYSVYENDIMADRIITNKSGATPNQLAATALATVPGIANACRLTGWEGSLLGYKQNNFYKDILLTDPSFLSIFDYKFIKGDRATAMSGPNSVVLTEKTAAALFGMEEPIGKIINLDHKTDLLVTGVIENPAKNQTYQFDLLIPWTFIEKINPYLTKMNWTDGALSTIIQLKDEKQFAAADAQVRKIFQENYHQNYIEFFLFPFKHTHLYDHFENGKVDGGKIDQIRLYLLLAACVLFIACINYMNLSTARSEKRAKEIGIRKTLGSTRKGIAGQFLTESLLLSIIALFCAFVLVEISLPYFNRLMEVSITINYINYKLWLSTISILLITGLIAGSYPALYLSSFMPSRALKGLMRHESQFPVRKILVVTQFAFSICMIVCAIVIRNQINFMSNRPSGFDKDNLVQMPVVNTLQDANKLNLFKSELLKSGAISAATTTSNGITNNYVSTEMIRWPGQQVNQQISMNLRFSDVDYVKTIGSRILTGRDFSREFGTDTAAVILNETAVKSMNLKDPIGKQLVNKDWDQTFTIIGVMKDYNYLSLGNKVQPVIFFNSQSNQNTLVMRLGSDQSAQSSINKIKALNEQFNPGYPLRLDFVSDRLVEKLKTERLLSIFSNVFGGFATLISCMGLLGLALYMAEQRSKEISIRKVIGATLQDILILLNKDFLKLVLISNVIAIPLAYLLISNWLQGYDYRITLNVWPFLSAFVLSIGIAVLSVSLQLFKISKANAVDALKYE